MGKKKQHDQDEDADVLTATAEPEKPAAKGPKPERKTIIADVRLEDRELLELGDELADLHDQLESQKGELKTMTENRKAAISETQARINTIVRKISSKTETREFFCSAECDFDLKIKRWVDVKTGEVRRTEELTARDYQQKMRFDEEQAENTVTELDVNSTESPIYIIIDDDTMTVVQVCPPETTLDDAIAIARELVPIRETDEGKCGWLIRDQNQELVTTWYLEAEESPVSNEEQAQEEQSL